MKNLIILVLFIIVLALIAYIVKEKFIYPTYTNTPSIKAVTPTDIGYWIDPAGNFVGDYSTIYSYPAGIPSIPHPSRMITSIRDPADFVVGKRVRAGVAYDASPNTKPLTVEVYQYNIDPYRGLYSYEIVDNHGIVYSLNLDPYTLELEDGDKFYVPELKRELTFKKDSDYIYAVV